MGDMLHAAVRNLRLVRSSLAKCQTADLVLRKTTAVVRRSQCSRPSTEVSNLINLRFGRAAPSSSPIPPHSDLGFLLVQVTRDAPLCKKNKYYEMPLSRTLCERASVCVL